jgi:hypothetical protein
LTGRSESFIDVNTIADTGSGNAPIVDLGAYESDGIAADLIASLANNVSGEVGYGGAFTWTLTITNTNAISARFTTSQIILQDDLPHPGAFYGIPVIQNTRGITGTVDCEIATYTLTCSAKSEVTMDASGSKFEVNIPVTLSMGGLLTNPRSEGVCSVDPNGVIVETDEDNNACNSDSVKTKPIPVFMPVIIR